MRDLLKNKKWTITIYILLIIFIFSTAFCYNLENRYKKLYFSTVFQSVDNLYVNSNQLKNQIEDIINYGSDLARKHEFIKNGKWIDLLNDLQRLCDKHSNLTKEFTNYKNKG